MALPVGGVAILLLVAFLQVKYDKSQTWASRASTGWGTPSSSAAPSRC
jgi:hypothetical protein